MFLYPSVRLVLEIVGGLQEPGLENTADILQLVKFL